MKKDFDHIAKDYDTDFTHSEIGKRQRASVYKYLQKMIDSSYRQNDSKENTVLELNCGTGEDAIWFAKQGNRVIATDISSEMIVVAKHKAKGINNLEFRQLDINNLNVIPTERGTSDEESQFSLIFSNFGGLNCLNPKQLQEFFKNENKIIADNGKLILVIMPKNTLWERVYFSLKGQFKKGKRRNTNLALNVNVEGKEVKTWYYNPKEIKKMASPYFKIIATKPIGFFIPPSYLENYFAKHKRFLNILDQLEKKIGKFGFLSRFSDHYLIELTLNRKKRKENYKVR